ncbi:hypothetical protein ACFY9G_23070 [Streptomyces anthocyanicus]|uniref:hypothetical protein n=1 Tax=Streptomyces anthocyanicus TaxID=68174 RepID=UPI0036DFBFC2
MTDQTTTDEPREPDNPAAWALAQHIADHPMSTVQAAFRYLNAPLTVELHEQPAVSLPATEARTRLLQALDAPYCQTLGFTPEGLLAAYEASRTQTVDDSAVESLSDTLYDALYAITPFAEKYFVDEGEGLRGAVRAVLEQAAVLPATTNHDTDTGGFELRGDTEIRTAVLREAADLLAAKRQVYGAPGANIHRRSPLRVQGMADAEAELRRVADETAATETKAAVPVQHAPGKVIRCPDCRTKGYTVCLDQPAAGARQDGAQR